MGIIKRAGDLVYTFRFLKLLTTSFEDTEAYKHGIIDKRGKRRKEFTLNTMDNRELYSNYYTPFHRLVFNVKKLIGDSKFSSYAAALYLIKEKFSISDKQINKSLELLNIDSLDLLSEQSEWFVLEDKRLSPGTYKILSDKVINESLEEVVRPRDKINVNDNCYPVGELFGIDIYEATHIRTNKTIYVTIGELSR